jgi:tRNA(fMet)-specific endonuclease VapC
MGYLLDTNTCSFVLKQKPFSVYKKLSTIQPSDVFVSVITVYELITGCEKSPKRNVLLSEVKHFLQPFSSLSFTEDHAHRAGSLRATLEKRGTLIGPYDLLLASQALVEDLTFVTNNTREFRRVKDLRLEDWCK